MTALAIVLLAIPVIVGGYAYVGYPLILRLLPRHRGAERPWGTEDWPLVSVTLAAYNEEKIIGATLEQLTTIEYPAERRQIVVISDASTDRTDDIARAFADRGVEVIRLPQRAGKTAAENASRAHVRGEIVINIDATVHLAPDALKPLVAAFEDATVGVASGRDVSVGNQDSVAGIGESGYVGYEMWVRDLETRVGSIVGASGCFFASRRALHSEHVPNALSRDFAAPLIAREHGYRSVSVPAARCYVPRTPSLRHEYRRKVRTMARGLDTLFYKRHLLNPLRHGMFAWMLFSHKLARWLVPWALVAGIAGLVLLSVADPRAWRVWAVLVAGTVGTMVAAWWWPQARRMPRLLGALAYMFFGLLAGLHAWSRFLRSDRRPVWEPTRRG